MASEESGDNKSVKAQISASIDPRPVRIIMTAKIFAVRCSRKGAELLAEMLFRFYDDITSNNKDRISYLRLDGRTEPHV
jgi:hypothetical protein